MIGAEHFTGALAGIDPALMMQLFHHRFINIEAVFLENDLGIGLKLERID
ncbi:hypothetical protein SDC9_162506 [bioreactor metagenome]|uniref:Uncharacterized protein n=1 Tax=bioreactor metagenome TaxID=1076179 RepID=A0A645FL83_9ZZZZ